MKIKALRVENFKRVKHVEIVPGERALIEICGNNRAGKSSVLDALTAVFGGKGNVPIEAVRLGSPGAEVSVTLDDGLTITRTVSKRGRHSLEVRGEGGAKLKSPQAVLDRLIGTRFLDPLAFTRADSKRQRAMLLDIVDVGIDLDVWAKERAEIYDARSEATRDRKRFDAELSGMPAIGEIPEPISVTELSRQLSDAHERARKLAEAQAEYAHGSDVLKSTQAEREQLLQRVAELDITVAGGEKYLASLSETIAEQTSAGPDRTVEIRGKIEQAEDHNRTVTARTEQKRRREEARKGRTENANAVEALTLRLVAHDETKRSALESAAMPIEGLGVDEEGVTFLGVPFAQASGAEQLHVSLSIAVALSPELRDIWVKDGSLLDETSMQALRDFSAEKECRIWIERVGRGDDDAIVIEAGEIEA